MKIFLLLFSLSILSSVDCPNFETEFIMNSARELRTTPSKEKVAHFRAWLKSHKVGTEFLKQAYERANKEMKRVSAEISRKLAHQKSLDEYDVLIVGDGPHAAITAANLRLENPNLKVLAITNAAEAGGTFRNVGEFYRLNSAELESKSTHYFPQCPFQLLDLSISGYVMAGRLGETTTLNLFSFADTLFSQTVTKISQTQENYITQLASGSRIKTKAVVIASGLGGNVSFGVKDTSSLEILQRNRQEALQLTDPQEAPQTEHYIDMAKRVTSLVRSGTQKDFMAPYRGKRIAVVGRGGGSVTVVEAFSGLGPGKIYGHEKNGFHGDKFGPSIGERDQAGNYTGVKSLDWWVQDSKSAEQFRSRNNERTWDTVGTPEVFDNIGKIRPWVSKVEVHIGHDGKKTYKLFPPFGKPREYDHIIFVTGYRNLPIEMTFGGQNPPAKKHIVKGRIPGINKDVAVASSFEPDPNTRRSIFVGPHAGKIVPKKEFMTSPTETWTSVDVLAQRTAAAARNLAENLLEPPR